ncbi:TrmH family RNA methyltransferase [Alkalinema pantanalense CENA528]|uniref:TrmH family RNA methyltransferase n=1 Tax=Alkalinema pantanalense TaxID=1620705 RepID=UPI003D6DCC25
MLTSLQNPLVKQLRKLQRAKERVGQGVFLLEGTHLLQEAKATNQPLNVVCCTEDWQNRYPDLFAWVMGTAQRLEQVSPEVLRAIATTVEPDGVVATVPRLHTQAIEIHSLGLVLESIQDPGNLGTMIRTAAAAGTEGLLVGGSSVDLGNPKVLRASAGQWFRLPMQVAPQLPELLQAHRDRGFQLVATLPTAQKSYWDVDFRQPTLVLMGNEGAGLSADLADFATLPVRIPLAPGVESLNVAIAAALILYEAQRQRQALP